MPRHRRPARFGPTIWLLVALATITVAAYAPLRHHDFVGIDDPIYVINNPHLRGGLTWAKVASAFGSSYANFWHPLTLLSLMLDVQLFGVSAGALHLSNLLLHVASTLVLFLVLLRMTGARGPSAFVAALFAVHPLHVESVGWIAERKDVLSTLFWMLTLWAYAGYARRSRGARYGLVVILFVLGLMAKPMLVTLPFTLLLLDLWPLGRVSLSANPACPRRWPALSRAWLPLLREKVPLFALAVAAGVIAFLSQQRGGAVAPLESFPMAGRVATTLVGYASYILKMIWPRTLVAFYPYPQTMPLGPAAAALAALAGVSVLVVRLASRHPYLAVGWFWYVGTLLPVSGLVQVGSHAMADRYTYVPLIGLFIMVAWGVPELFGRGRARRAILTTFAAGAVVACVVATRAQVMTWRNSVTLWQHALRVMPDNYYAHNALGLELYKQGLTDEAAAHFLRSAELAPGFPNPHNNLGLLLAERGRTAEAIEQYNEALRRWPDYPQAHVNLGNALLTAGRARDAVAHFDEALRLGTDPATARTGLGNALMATGRSEEAIGQYEEALRLNPTLAAAHYNLGNAQARIGRLEVAIDCYREALRLEPGSVDTRNNLGVALEKLGRHEEAVAQFTEALRRNPNSPSANTNLGNALLGAGRPAEAVEQLREALRLKPDYAEAHMNLGTALFATNRFEEALGEHREAVRLDPGSANAHYNLALTLQRMGRLAEAVVQYQDTLRVEGDSADVRVALGAALERLGRLQEAVGQYREALRLEAGSAEASAGLARVLAAQNRREP